MIVSRKEAVELISGMLNNDINLEGEELEKVIFAVNEDIQVRDWMMGLPIKWSLEESIKFMQYMAVHTTAQDSVPFITVQAIFYYELSEHEKAIQCLNYALCLSLHICRPHERRRKPCCLEHCRGHLC